MFKIGEFSKMVRVSARMLRYYEQNGLLFPAEVDRFTGYRLYSAAQMPFVFRITQLRDAGFGVDEIKSLLPRYHDSAVMREALERKSREIKSAIAEKRDKLEKIAALSGKFDKEYVIMVYDVEVKVLPAVKVLTLRGIIPHYRDEGLLWEKLGRYIGEKQISCGKDGYSTYFDEEYKETNPDVEIAIPVDSLGESSGDLVFKEYPEIPKAAVVRFSGPFDGGYDAASEKLADWMENNGYILAGNLRGHVIVSPHDDENPNNWLTELQAPITKK
jgi:DNA-binding transcriptional MerR regulator/effector-binding domain-containing protein